MTSCSDSDRTASGSCSFKRQSLDAAAAGINPTIDDFQIIKPISRGAYAKVYLGYKHMDPERLYAIKVLFTQCIK